MQMPETDVRVDASRQKWYNNGISTDRTALKK
jgi:hypothetical protein